MSYDGQGSTQLSTQIRPFEAPSRRSSSGTKSSLDRLDAARYRTDLPAAPATASTDCFRASVNCSENGLNCFSKTRRWFNQPSSPSTSASIRIVPRNRIRSQPFQQPMMFFSCFLINSCRASFLQKGRGLPNTLEGKRRHVFSSTAA